MIVTHAWRCPTSLGDQVPTIGLAQFKKVFRESKLEGVVVVMKAQREWHFTFPLTDPLSGAVQSFALHTSKGGRPRTWADPRKLFALLESYGLKSATIRLETYQNHEATIVH